MRGVANSLVQALQACLNHDWCAHVVYQPSNHTAALCAVYPTNTAPHTTTSEQECLVLATRATCPAYSRHNISAVSYALSNGCKAVDDHGNCVCGPGMFTHAPHVGTEGCAHVICVPCLHGMCDILPDAKQLPSASFNDKLQQFSSNLHNNASSFRAFNAGLVSVRGTVHAAVRMSNNNNCPGILKQKFNNGNYTRFQSGVALCQLDGIADHLTVRHCTEVNTSGFLAKTGLSLVAPKSWVDIIDPRNFFDDPRGFDLDTEYYISGSVMHDERVSIGVMKFQNDPLEPVEGAVVSNCSAETFHTQKNWQPLSLNNALHYLTRLSPLTVIRPELKTGGCEVIQTSEYKAEELLDLSFAARGVFLTKSLKGSSNFIQTRPAMSNGWAWLILHPKIITNF